MAKSDDEVRSEFDEAVNMSASDLRDWLETDEARSVGQGSDDGESTGHESGRLIADILERDPGAEEETEDDLDQKRRTVSYVHRHLAQRPDGDVTHTDWRYSLMNWGHDPLED